MKKDKHITKKSLFWRVMKTPAVILACILGPMLILFLAMGILGKNSVGTTIGLMIGTAVLYLAIAGAVSACPCTGLRWLAGQERYLNRSFEEEMRGKSLGRGEEYITYNWYVRKEKSYLYIFHRDAVQAMGEIYRKDTTRYGMDVILRSNEVCRLAAPMDKEALERLRAWYYQK